MWWGWAKSYCFWGCEGAARGSEKGWWARLVLCPQAVPRHVAWPGCCLQGANCTEASFKRPPSDHQHLCHPRKTSAPSSAGAWGLWTGSHAPLIPIDVVRAPPAPGTGSAAAPSLAHGRTGPCTGFYFPSPPFTNNLLQVRFLRWILATIPVGRAIMFNYFISKMQLIAGTAARCRACSQVRSCLCPVDGLGCLAAA